MKKIKYGLVVTGLALSTLFSQVFSQEREYSGHNLEEKRDISSSLPEYLSEIGEIASSGAADLLE
ncbi:MAG TPA: hypothetical protein VHA52_02020, partial [Candidatus Babeliaceae bacterium]|nr:hypothetical protein [Candidatus Babeliaceae bacterium]